MDMESERSIICNALAESADAVDVLLKGDSVRSFLSALSNKSFGRRLLLSVGLIFCEGVFIKTNSLMARGDMLVTVTSLFRGDSVCFFFT